MQRRLFVLVVVGLFGALGIAPNAEAGHRKKNCCEPCPPPPCYSQPCGRPMKCGMKMKKCHKPHKAVCYASYSPCGAAPCGTMPPSSQTYGHMQGEAPPPPPPKS
jgi:hypothetical protein